MAQNIPHKIAPLAAAFAALTFSISIHAVSFDPIKTETVDSDPRGLASGDLNNDGIPDLVSANNDAGNVSVLLGKTDNSGDFDPAINTAVGNGPFSLAIGDVLGAGTNADVVVAKWGDSGGDNEITILVGNGDGTFDTPVALNPAPVPALEDPRDVILADIDSDGDLDIIVAQWGAPMGAEPSVRIFLNDNAATTFTEQPNSPFVNSGAFPFGLVYADATGDGISDIVLANVGASDTVSILIGENAGTTFTNSFTVATGASPFTVAVADLDGVLGPDLAVANSGGDSISILLSSDDLGMGNFEPKVDTSVGTSPREIAIVNISGDANLDVVVSNQDSDNISVLEGDGTGGFTGAADNFPAGTTPSPLVVDDFDSDGNVDVAVANISAAGGAASTSVSVLINDANQAPSFTSTPVTDATQDAVYTYNITTTDPDAGDTLTITAPTLPAWLTLDDKGDGTATLTGTPASADVGDNAVELLVTDDGTGNLTGTQAFTVTVAAININEAPSFTSTPVTDATQDAVYTYDITTTDPDAGDTLTITAPTLPAWLTLDDKGDGTATLTGTPASADVGDNAVELLVTDDGTGNLTGSQAFTVTVAAASTGGSSSSSSSSGCTLNTAGSTAKDPLMPLLLVAAMAALYRRRNRKSIKGS